MGATNPLLVALGLGNGTLEHMKQVANSVKPTQIAHVQRVFEQGAAVMTDSHGHLESSVDKVVTGWKGQAAAAASSKVVTSALASSQSSDYSATAQTQAAEYAQQLTAYQSKINAIPAVDTSFSAAVQASGGPAGALLNPGSVATNMAAAQAKSFAHREQAAGHLNEMDDASTKMAASFKSAYTPIPSSKPPAYDSLPATLSVQPVNSSGGGGGSTNVPTPRGGGSTPGTNPGGRGPGIGTFIDPGGKLPPKGGTKIPPGTVEVPGLPLPGGGTTTTGTTGDPGPGGTSNPVALPGPVGGGGGGSGSGVGGIGAGIGVAGGALAGAGALAGMGRGGPGALGRSSGLTDEEARLRAAGRSGMSGAVDEDGSMLRGRGGSSELSRSSMGARGFGGASEEMPLRANGASDMARSGLGGRGFGGGMGEEMPLRASGLSGASAGELSAGQRGNMMPGGGRGAGRDDEDELNKRPDYLVETDDIWGDGRLAAPPVLG